MTWNLYSNITGFTSTDKTASLNADGWKQRQRQTAHHALLIFGRNPYDYL